MTDSFIAKIIHSKDVIYKHVNKFCSHLILVLNMCILPRMLRLHCHIICSIPLLFYQASCIYMFINPNCSDFNKGKQVRKFGVEMFYLFLRNCISASNYFFPLWSTLFFYPARNAKIGIERRLICPRLAGINLLMSHQRSTSSFPSKQIVVAERGLKSSRRGMRWMLVTLSRRT